MNTVYCSNCKTVLPLESLFCKQCGAQIKCKKCHTLRDENANFCMVCGEPYNSISGNTEKAINKIEFAQKGNSKTMAASFTNDVGFYLANAFNSVVTGHPILTKNPFRNQLQMRVGKSNSNTLLKEPTTDIQDAEVVEMNYMDTIAKIFTQNDDGKLEIVDNRLKEKSKFDKTKRLAVLYVYAKKMSGNEFTEREELNDIITQQKLKLKDFRKFLSMDMQKYFSEKEKGKFTLIAGGTDFAEKILKEIANPDYQAITSKAGRKVGKKTSNTSPSSTNIKEAKKSGSSNPSALEMMKRLIEENYFSINRKLNDIITHCDVKKAVKFSPQNISATLSRLVKDNILERERKDGQYEYWKK